MFEDDDTWKDCWNCGGSGYSGHECGDDTCACLEPEDNVICSTCEGQGGWATNIPLDEQNKIQEVSADSSQH